MDYEKMYYKLFSSVTNAILILQEAQRETAEMFASADKHETMILDGSGIKNRPDKDNND